MRRRRRITTVGLARIATARPTRRERHSRKRSCTSTARSTSVTEAAVAGRVMVEATIRGRRRERIARTRTRCLRVLSRARRAMKCRAAALDIPKARMPCRFVLPDSRRTGADTRLTTRPRKPAQEPTATREEERPCRLLDGIPPRPPVASRATARLHLLRTRKRRHAEEPPVTREARPTSPSPRPVDWST
jgi:hypothetical protein